MKWMVAALMMLLAIDAAAYTYVDANATQQMTTQHAATSIGSPFTIPDSPLTSDPEAVYAALQEAADEAGLNVFRTSGGFDTAGRYETTHYVLLVGETRFFDAFSLDSGRYLNAADASQPERFLSTAPSTDQNQVGILSDLGGDDLVAVRELRAAYDTLPAAGGYVVETSDPSSFDRFLGILAQALSGGRGDAGPISIEALKMRTGWFDGYSTGYQDVLEAIQLLIISISALFLAFAILASTKKIGIMRLNGFGPIRIWFETSGRLTLICLAISEALALPSTMFVHDATAGFTVSVGLGILRAFAFMLAVSGLVFVLVAGARVSEAIKNRKNTPRLFAINSLVKVACSIAVIAAASGLWLQMEAVNGERQRFASWDRARGYGIFYPTSAGNDMVDYQTGTLGPTGAEAADLYPMLAAQGALYVDATQLEPAALLNGSVPGTYSSIVVNTNYLNVFPVLDSSGKKVVVDDASPSWIVLVPEGRRAEEAQILSFFGCRRTGCNGGHGVATFEEAMFGKAVPASISDQSVSIVWTRDNQDVFSFDPSIAPDDGNLLRDPIVEVMTSSNSLDVDRLNAFSGLASTALKVKLIDGDTKITLESLGPTLRRLKLDDNLHHLVTMDEYASERIAELDQAARGLALVGLGFLVGVLVMAVQLQAILFGRYSRRIVVRRLFGQAFTRAYREPLVVFVSVWALQLAGALIANRLGLNPFAVSTTPSGVAIAPDGLVVAAALVVALIEAVFSVWALLLIERRSVVRVLKQDF